MAGWQREVGRFGGAPVVLDLRAAITAVLLPLLVLAYLVDRTAGPVAAVVAASVLAAVLLGASFLAHELAHAVVARRLGIPVERIVLGPLGAGVQLDDRRLRPGSTAAVAVVGPLASLGLGAVGLLAMQVVPGGRTSLVWWTLAVVSYVSGALGVLNLLPALPLDGGKVLAALVWRVTGDRLRGAVVAARAGYVLAVLVLVIFVVRPWLDGAAPDVVLLALAGATAASLWVVAHGSLRAARARARIETLRLADLVVPAVALPATDTLADLDAMGGPPAVVLGRDGRPTGYLDGSPPYLDGSPPVPAEVRAATPLSTLARPLADGASVDLHLTGADAVRTVAAAVRHSTVLAVQDDGVVVGLLRVADVLQAVQALRSGRG